MSHRLISARDTAAFYGIGQSTLWRWINEGRIPQPIRIGRRTFWDFEMLEQHVNSLSGK
jgi:predicted DNA-binding transcriptional regulator AlpA